jgi:hypothetical protein
MIQLALSLNRNLATLQLGTSAQLLSDDAATEGAFSPLEIEIELPCQDCGCRSIFAAVAPDGQHQNLGLSALLPMRAGTARPQGFFRRFMRNGINRGVGQGALTGRVTSANFVNTTLNTTRR